MMPSTRNDVAHAYFHRLLHAIAAAVLVFYQPACMMNRPDWMLQNFGNEDDSLKITPETFQVSISLICCAACQWQLWQSSGQCISMQGCRR